MAFKPNSVTYDQGIQSIADACRQVGLDVNKQVITSQDPVVRAAVAALVVTNVPAGFSKFHMPFSFDRAQVFLSYGAPGTKVPRHSHDEGPGFRYIASGSIIYNGLELKAGDWMYIPAGLPYEFEVGLMGVGMCYCYQCSCR